MYLTYKLRGSTPWDLKMVTTVPMFETYKQVEKYYSTRRSDKKGKPLFTWARIFKKGDTYEFHTRRQGVFAIVHPDDTLEFQFDKISTSQMSPSLSYGLDNIFPLKWMRISTAIHGVIDYKTTDKIIKGLEEAVGTLKANHVAMRDPDEYYAGWHVNRQFYSSVKQHAKVVKTGVKYNLRTHEWTDAIPYSVAKSPTNNDAAKEWRASLKKFRQAIEIRSKLGVFNGPEFHNIRYRVTTDENIDSIYTAMKTDVYSTEFLKHFHDLVISVSWHKGRIINHSEFMRRANQLMKRITNHLRIKFGVFDKPQEENVNV